MMKYMSTMMAIAKAKFYSFLHDEKGDVNIVSIVVLIGIAVLLAIIFRGAIENLLNTLFNTIEKNATNAIS